MTLGSRDKRALLLLGGAVAVFLVMWFANGPSSPPAVVGKVESIPQAEARLARLRALAATVPGKQVWLDQTNAELAGREKGIFDAQTAAQAQAQLLDTVRRVGQAQTPPMQFGTVELSQEVKKLGDYGEVQISVPFTCRIEELVNFLAELAAQPEALATHELRIAAKDEKQKTITVRLTVSGLVPKRLIPAKKGLAAL